MLFWALTFICLLLAGVVVVSFWTTLAWTPGPFVTTVLGYGTIGILTAWLSLAFPISKIGLATLILAEFGLLVWRFADRYVNLVLFIQLVAS